MSLHITRRRFFASSAAALAFGARSANAAPSRKDIDLKTGASGDPTWVLFFARLPSGIGSPAGLSPAGHAFIGVGSEDSLKQQSWIKAFGLHPKSQIEGGLSVFGPVPGELKKDAWSISDIIISCAVGSREFQAVSKIIDAWTQKTNNDSAEYQLMHQDCVSFSFEVANALKLKLPPRETFPDTIQLPVSLTRKLADLNSTMDFGNGVWNSNDSGNRWKLEIDYDQVKWTEKNPTGQTLTKSMKLEPDGNRAYKISRDNSSDVLDYLGARGSAKQTILGRSPSASYMKLQRSSDQQFSVQWYGLKWTLDKNGNVVQVLQPGSQPPASFTLIRST